MKKPMEKVIEIEKERKEQSEGRIRKRFGRSTGEICAKMKL